MTNDARGDLEAYRELERKSNAALVYLHRCAVACRFYAPMINRATLVSLLHGADNILRGKDSVVYDSQELGRVLDRTEHLYSVARTSEGEATGYAAGLIQKLHEATQLLPGFTSLQVGNDPESGFSFLWLPKMRAGLPLVMVDEAPAQPEKLDQIPAALLEHLEEQIENVTAVNPDCLEEEETLEDWQADMREAVDKLGGSLRVLSAPPKALKNRLTSILLEVSRTAYSTKKIHAQEGATDIEVELLLAFERIRDYARGEASFSGSKADVERVWTEREPLHPSRAGKPRVAGAIYPPTAPYAYIPYAVFQGKVLYGFEDVDGLIASCQVESSVTRPIVFLDRLDALLDPVTQVEQRGDIRYLRDYVLELARIGRDVKRPERVNNLRRRARAAEQRENELQRSYARLSEDYEHAQRREAELERRVESALVYVSRLAGTSHLYREDKVGVKHYVSTLADVDSILKGKMPIDYQEGDIAGILNRTERLDAKLFSPSYLYPAIRPSHPTDIATLNLLNAVDGARRVIGLEEIPAQLKAFEEIRFRAEVVLRTTGVDPESKTLAVPLMSEPLITLLRCYEIARDQIKTAPKEVLNEGQFMPKSGEPPTSTWGFSPTGRPGELRLDRYKYLGVDAGTGSLLDRIEAALRPVRAESEPEALGKIREAKADGLLALGTLRERLSHPPYEIGVDAARLGRDTSVLGIYNTTGYPLFGARFDFEDSSANLRSIAESLKEMGEQPNRIEVGSIDALKTVLRDKATVKPDESPALTRLFGFPIVINPALKPTEVRLGYFGQNVGATLTNLAAANYPDREGKSPAQGTAEALLDGLDSDTLYLPFSASDNEERNKWTERQRERISLLRHLITARELELGDAIRDGLRAERLAAERLKTIGGLEGSLERNLKATGLLRTERDELHNKVGLLTELEKAARRESSASAVEALRQKGYAEKYLYELYAYKLAGYRLKAGVRACGDLLRVLVASLPKVYPQPDRLFLEGGDVDLLTALMRLLREGVQDLDNELRRSTTGLDLDSPPAPPVLITVSIDEMTQGKLRRIGEAIERMRNLAEERVARAFKVDFPVTFNDKGEGQPPKE